MVANLWMLIGAKPDTKLEEIQGIEYAILDPDNNPDAVTKLNALASLINGLGTVADEESSTEEKDFTITIYFISE